jgi:hypothetical protein
MLIMGAICIAIVAAQTRVTTPVLFERGSAPAVCALWGVATSGAGARPWNS